MATQIDLLKAIRAGRLKYVVRALDAGVLPDDPEGGGPVYHITYAPQYCFEGGAPSREDMTDAEHISQEEFERRMNQWMKDNARKRF